VKIVRLAYESARRQRQLDAPEWLDPSADRVSQIAYLRRRLRQGCSQDIPRLVLHRTISLRCPQSQRSLQALIQIADRNARYEHLAEIIAISLITISYARNRGMCETLGTIPPGAIGFAGLSQGAMNDGERAPTGWQKARSGGLARFGMSLLCRRS
jgi:hypothetical protein